MKTRNSAWVMVAIICFAAGMFLGREAKSLSVTPVKPNSEAPPLFTPVTATLAQQKMCDQQAARKFSENGHGSLDSYTSHYDPKVNVCYMRVDSIAAKPLMSTAVVYDAFGGRIYANYMWINAHNKKSWEVPPSTCQIHIPGKPDEICTTATQFDDLTEKYFGVSP